MGKIEETRAITNALRALTKPVKSRASAAFAAVPGRSSATIAWPQAGETKKIMNNMVEAIEVKEGTPFYELTWPTEATVRIGSEFLASGKRVVHLGRTGDGRYVFAVKQHRLFFPGGRPEVMKLPDIAGLTACTTRKARPARKGGGQRGKDGLAN